MQRLRDLGWVDDSTATIVYRWAEGRNESHAEVSVQEMDLFSRRVVGWSMSAGMAATSADCARARAVRIANANRRAADLAPTIQAIQSMGNCSFQAVAAGLNARGITAARGGTWSAAQARKILMRIGASAMANRS